MTLVSVLMPAYNHERWIAEAVGSVLAQTHTDLELVVVDDGCSDRTPEVLATFDDPRVRVLTHPGRANRGLHESLRLALSHARGEWLSFLASDDAWEPVRLERLLAAGADAVYCRAALMDETSTLTGETWGAAPSTGDLFDDLLVTNLVPSATIVVRKAVFEAAGGVSDERFEDLDVMLRISARERVAFVDEPLARYRVNTTGIAAQVKAVGRDLDEYASAVAHVASSPYLPESRRPAAAAAAAAWSIVLGVPVSDPPATADAYARRIKVAWGLLPPPSLLERVRRRLRRW